MQTFHVLIKGLYNLPKIQLLCHFCIVNHGLSSETCANPLISMAYGVNEWLICGSNAKITDYFSRILKER